MLAQRAHERAHLLGLADLQADEDVRRLRIGEAVVELGDVVVAEDGAELLQRTGALGDGHRQHRLAALADFGALGDVAQPVEIHVRTGGDGDEVLVLQALTRRVALEAGVGQRAGGLQDRAAVLENILDGGADFVVANDDHLVHILAAEPERLLAHLAHGHAVGEDADVVERYALCRP